MKIEFSSEFMTNQKHATVMSPQGQFRVLQSQQSHIVAFSIGTDNVLYRTMEQPKTKAGWTKLDESTSLSAMFGGAQVAAKLFDVSDNTFIGVFDIAMAVTVGGVDHLVISLSNPNLDNSWESPLRWVSIPFDDPGAGAKNLVIEGIYLLRDKTSSYIMVDTLKDPTSPLPLIERYYIDPSKLLSGRYWNKHELSISLEAGNVSSALGRKSGQVVGGIYTMGTLTNKVEMIYSQIYNPFNPIHGNPLVSRFELPPNAVNQETAFALGNNADGTTDLYVAAAGGLYYLAAKDQKDQAKFDLIASHTLLHGVNTIGVDVNGDNIVVWGLNKFGKVFALRNKTGLQKDAGAWSVPVPILANGLRLSSLINRVVGGSVLFAHTADDDLVRLSLSPVTQLWSKRSIVLPPTDPKDMITVNTYTTHIQLNGDDNLPLGEQTVAFTAASPVSVYINNQYTNLYTDSQVEVKSTNSGVITILQEVKSLGAVAYRIDAGGLSIPIDPMSKAMTKLAGVQNGSDLDVEISNSRGQKRPLVPSGVSSGDKDAAAKQVAQFVKISSTLPPDGTVAERSGKPRAFDSAKDRIFGIRYTLGSATYFDTFEGAVAAGVLPSGDAAAQYLAGGIWSVAGDIWEWISHAFEAVEEFFATVIDDIATCFVKIAGEIYQFILDCVESVANGINFILQKIEVFIKDLISWLGFLFEWPDIVRTHRVLLNVFKQFGRYSIDQLDTFKTDIQAAFTTIDNEIKKWANLPVMPDSASSIGSNNPPGSSSYDPQAHWGTYHLTGGTDSSQTSYSQSVPEQSPLEKLLGEVVAALEREGTVFEDALKQLKTEVIDKFQSLTLTQMLEKVVAIVLVALLETIENVILTAIDIIQILVDGVIDFLDAPIDVPIISQLYYEATEGDTLTILDAVCLVVAIPATILYKIEKKVTPFPDDAFTKALINAPDFATIRALYKGGPNKPHSLQDGQETAVLKTVCFAVAVPAAVVIAFTTPIRAATPTNLPAAIIGTVAYFFYCAPNLPGVVEDDRSKWYNIVNSCITSVSLVKACGDIGLTKYDEDKSGKCLTFWNKVSPGVEFLINFFWFCPVIGSIVDNHDATAIVNCVSNSAFNIAGMSALPISLKVPYAILGFEVANGAYGVLELVQCFGPFGNAIQARAIPAS